MESLKSLWLSLMVVVFLCALTCTRCEGQFLDYDFEGVITGVFENENDVIPGLAVGDTFFGGLRFDSQGWQNTAGIISVFVNGVELRFEGDSIFGGLSIDPFYSFRIMADQAGFGADIRNSTFSAGSFGLTLEDMDPSPFYNDTFPVFLSPEDYERNEFSIFGTVIASDDRVSAVGELTWLGRVAVDCFGDNNGDGEWDIDDINGFAEVIGESALFNRCFDLNEDGVVNLNDHDIFITQVVSISPDDRGTFIGDVNLDGTVDVLNDGFTLVGNLGKTGPFGYQDGDLNADGKVDVLNDAFRLIQNLGR